MYFCTRFTIGVARWGGDEWLPPTVILKTEPQQVRQMGTIIIIV